MRSYEEIEKNAYKKAEIHLAEMRRRNTIIKRTALSSGICAAAIAGVWFVSGENTRDSFKKKHDEGIITDEELPSEEYSGHIYITTTTGTVSAVNTTTASAAKPSTDAPEGIPVTTTTRTTENIPSENTVTTTENSTSQTTTKKTSVTTANRTTRTTQSSQPVSTDDPAKTTARPTTTSKRPTITTVVSDITTSTAIRKPSPQPVSTTTYEYPWCEQSHTTTTTKDDCVAMPVTTSTWQYDDDTSPNPTTNPTTTEPVPSNPGEPTVVIVNNQKDAERIFTTYTDFDGIEYRLVDPKNKPQTTDKHLYVMLLSVYDPDEKVYYNAYVNMYTIKDSNLILLRNDFFTLLYEPV